MKELVSLKGFLKCGVTGCAEGVHFKDGNEYFCLPHGEEMQAARTLESTIKSYAQSIYVAAVAPVLLHEDVQIMTEAAQRDYFRDARRTARVAAEVLLERTVKP